MTNVNRKENGKIRVLVTGASGYIALHCVQQLLEQGYSVRGTVRNLENSSKINPLRHLKYSSERLELVEADLECPEHWPRCVDGCDYILHVASPWPIVADESTIGVAVNGTAAVLSAASKCPTVKKIVLTSSCAAINDGHRNDSRIFDEECWTNLESKRVEHYARSKTLAEKSAWDFWRTLNPKTRFQLTVLNPTFVTGPVLSNQPHGSATVIGRMMSYRTFLAAPKVSLGLVDVRDVARAHLLAMRNPHSDGERILVTATPSAWFSEILKWLRVEFEPQGFLMSRITAPDWLFKLYVKLGVDSHSAAIAHRLGNELRFDNTKSKELLSMTYIEPKKSVIDMAYSLIDFSMINRKPKYSPKKAKSAVEVLSVAV